MIPNPYFNHPGARMGDLDMWRRTVDEIRAASKARPTDQRKAKAFWRGECENNEWKRDHPHYSVNENVNEKWKRDHPHYSVNEKRALRNEHFEGWCASEVEN